jgi:hypothetical protein
VEKTLELERTAALKSSKAEPVKDEEEQKIAS